MRLRYRQACAVAALMAALALAPASRADEGAPQDSAAADTLFRHGPGRLWLSGQVNEIYQYHGDFPAAYSGANSLRPTAESALSSLWSVYGGYQFTRRVEVLLDLERALGGGLSEALGLAGFSNLDVVRSPSLSRAPYLSRLLLHAVIPLGSASTKNARNPLSTFEELPERRLELRFGKFGTVDFFDVNAVGSDSHRQFMNWAVDNDGAYDYMADTRGYTVGLIAEYVSGWWTLRGAVGLMPVVANGPKLDTDIGNNRGQNLELELRPSLLKERTTTLRLLVYRNLARMGVYRDALRLAEISGMAPDVAKDDQPGRSKTGFGLNVDQELSEQIRVFARAGWNDGKTESFAYTEIDRTVAFGADARVPGRPRDRLGLAMAVNGLSPDHRDYVAAGGLGFIIGDGALRYGHEQILEGYYTLGLFRGVSVAGDVQWIHDPGYNRDRGPVLIGSLRLHLEL